MIDTLRHRLKGRGIDMYSFGGQIVLISAVLDSISIFYMLFLKMPSQSAEGDCWDSKKLPLGWGLIGKKDYVGKVG